MWSLRLSGWFQLQSWKFMCSCRVQIQCQRVMLRHMGSFVSSCWSVEQQQSREGGCGRVLVQQIGSWLQRGKLDYLASSMKQPILFSCLQIFFPRIFGWHVSIFVIGEMKEPKECLLLSNSRQKNICLTGCWISLLESLLGSMDSSRTLYTPLPLWGTDKKWTSTVHSAALEGQHEVTEGKELWVGAFPKRRQHSVVGGVRYSSLSTQYPVPFCSACLLIPEKH